jgi:hypothetical protein
MRSFLEFLIETNNSSDIARRLLLHVIDNGDRILGHKGVSVEHGTLTGTGEISKNMSGTKEIKQMLGGFASDVHREIYQAATHTAYMHRLIGGGGIEKIDPNDMEDAVDVLHGHLTDNYLGNLNNINESKSPAWTRKEGKDPKGGLNRKGVASYRRANPGSKLKMAVTKDPSKIKKGSKDDKRRKSFCSRMTGMKRKLTSAKTARDPDSRINKALRKWNC